VLDGVLLQLHLARVQFRAILGHYGIHHGQLGRVAAGRLQGQYLVFAGAFQVVTGSKTLAITIAGRGQPLNTSRRRRCGSWVRLPWCRGSP